MGRIIHFDILKCLAIFMVVVGHCLQRSYMAYDVVTTSFYDDSVFKFIYGCHLPLFMAISGYFFYGTIRKYTFREVVKSRFTRFVVPIITWHVFWMITDGFSNQGNGYTCSTFIKGFLLHYWFLWAVFFCSLAVLFVRKLFGEGLDIYFILIPLSLLLPNALNISRYVFLFPYFLIGYVWQIKKKDFTSIQAILGGAISFFLYIVLLCFFSQEHFIYTSGTCIFKDGGISLKQLGIDLVRYLVGFVGVLFFYFFVLLLKEIRFPQLMVKIGSKTMGIYIIHMFFTPFISHFQLGINYLFILLEAIIFILVSYIITILISKSKKLNLILLGN